MQAGSLDHVALWVPDREALGGFLVAHLGMHEISRGEDFTLLGVDAREGKLTLFDADGPREPGVLERVGLRVGDLEAALARLPAGVAVERSNGAAELTAPAGLRLALIERPGLDYDLDHVVFRVPEPQRTFAALASLGFSPADGRLEVADRHVRLVAGHGGASDRPLLNHIALLVDSAEGVREEAVERGLEIDRVVDAENTLAVFVRGPDGILVEYVEHKPGFALV